MPKALASFFEGISYEDTVRNAVSLGGDTDTLAAIAGAMADAMYGIPEDIEEEGRAHLPKDLRSVVEKFEDFARENLQPKLTFVEPADYFPKEIREKYFK